MMRSVLVFMVLLILVGLIPGLMQAWKARPADYQLNSQAQQLIGLPVKTYGMKLTYDAKAQTYEYNKDYAPAAESTDTGNVSGPRFSASFKAEDTKAYTISDPVNKVGVTFTPQFETATPQKDANRLVYPLRGLDGQKVVSLKASRIKEDIIINSFEKAQLEFSYKIGLPNGAEARMENNGSIGVYGVTSTLLGNVSAGTDSDKALLDKARKNGEKNNLLFTIPAPFIVESNKKSSQAKARYQLEGNKLTIIASGLDKATYPLSIDPSVYIETAAKLMKGNNETNTDFDVDSELIQKSQTTGARIDEWSDTTDMSSAVYNQGMAAAGGYIYRAGGYTSQAIPRIVSKQATTQSSDSLTFTMNLPSTRPAGDLYVALVCKDGNNRITPPAGWTEYADLQQHGAFYKVGTDQGGGNEAATYQWTVATTAEEWSGVILRIKDFDAADVVSGTAGTGSSGSAVVPVYPTTTPDTQGSLVVRSSGFNEDVPPSYGWGPGGDHSEIVAGNSGGAGDCGYTVDALDVPPASGVATGTATLSSTAGINDTYGASSIAIKGVSASQTIQSSLQWSKFNSSTGAIESPNPGTGACSGWCTNAAYNLPEGRVGFSLTAYNGYLYAMGGHDGTNRESTVFIAKLGANGEPSLWHPTDTNPNNWVYWYSDASLNGATARAYHSAVAYNNRMYVLGGATNASTGGVTTVEMADITPNGTLRSWTITGMQVLPDVRLGQSVHVYNDTMYLIGGNSNGTLRNTVYYSKLNSDGTTNTWTATNSFTTARTSSGGVMSGIWGGYLYLAGGCSAIAASPTYYCSTTASDVQLASINSDGSIATWNTITNLRNQRQGYSFVAWQNGLYRFGGCSRQDTSTGQCYATHLGVQYGVINQDGDASTVDNSEPSGTAPCSGGTPLNCDLPPVGDGAGQGGQMSSMTVINNGFIYNISGCTDISQTNECTNLGGTLAAMSGNTSYAALNSAGQMTAPATCPGTSYGLWCVDSTNQINNATGVGTSSATVFNNTIYVIGGTTGLTWQSTIWRVGVNSDGSLTGSWTTQLFANLDLGTARGYSYAFTRANPTAAATYPGNLYVLGGCHGASISSDGIGCSTYFTEVYKCNIMTTGALEEANADDCTTTGQLQIDADNVVAGNQGLGLMAGTIYANRVYLVGGSCTDVGGVNDPCGDTYAANRRDTIYARIDNSNNIVAESGGVWQFTTGLMNPVRRRAVSFGYNGYIYSLAGYSGTSSLQDLLFAKIDVSTGDMGSFGSSGVVVTPRWDLRAIVGNGYVYAIGGCATGAAPDGCTDMQEEIQTFQLYNNDSGAPVSFTAASDDTFAADTDRWGASAAVLNGYVYVAGGCISATDCTNATNNVQYAPLSASDGSIGTWASATNVLLADRAWGQLEVAGGNLYYLGGQDDTATNEQSTVYYASTFSSGNITAAWSTASGGIGDTSGQAAQARTKFGATVWNNRIYVIGGLDVSAANTNTVYVSPQLNSGGDIAADSWTSDADTLNVARWGNTVIAYANNLYSFGGNNGTQYLNDSQYTQINSDGTIDAWSYTTSLPTSLSESEGFAYNGYMYLIGGRSAASTCAPNTIVAPISANTTIASGNNPTGIGEWYETNQQYTGDRYGAAVAYANGKALVMGGGCTAPLATTRHYQTTLKAQPQVAKYSRMIDTDTDVFPTKWLLNGLDNSIGARWQARYRSMHDQDTLVNPNEDCGTSSTMSAMTTWGQETNFGDVTLGTPNTYTPLNSTGGNINCARYYYFSVSIDASQTFGYPEDVTRGPTISDLSLFFTADPSKRLRHGKTFTGGEQQPLDTPF